ncbi:MAG: hypothetical protein HC809_09065 [Gammaproteobacteria bacterium]|nr:hypothetical protein [Gammaproteobacteria bacterium]
MFSKTGIPDPVWLVAAGVLLGPIFHVVPPDLLMPAIPYFGAIALTVILTGGAYRLQLHEVANAAPRGLLLGLVGFAFAMLGIGAFFFFGIRLGVLTESPPLYWLLVGGIVGGTSALVVMPTVAGGKIDSRTARTLEVESSATDALCVVVAMAMLDLMVSGVQEVSQPFITLARQIGVGIGAGVAWSILLVPFYPVLRGRLHSYTLLIATMFLLYALTSAAKGNGAMAVLVAALLLGNAATLVPRIIPGAHPSAFTHTEEGVTMQQQLTFLIKSFFFVLIGLNFPTDARSILLGVAAAFTLLLFRIPAVLIAARGAGFTPKQVTLLVVSLPRGLAAGVLSTLPLQFSIPGTEALAGAVFSMIVTTILLFALGFGIASRMSESVSEAERA